MPRKCMLILLDGVGDHAHESLGHKTPLQAADTPALDRLATLGANGLYHPAALGQALPSELAHFAMFGYDPEDFPGRGPLEALGAGVDVGPDDVAVLAHFACLSDRGGELWLDLDAPEADEGEARALAAAVGAFETEGVEIRFARTQGTHGVLILRGGVSPFVTDTNPMRTECPIPEVLPWGIHTADPETRRAARALKRFLVWAHGRLKDHPVNARRAQAGLPPLTGLVTQRAGRLKPIRPFRQQNGLRGLSLASAPVYWGLCAHLGLDVRRVADTEDPGWDLAERLRLAREALPGYDFIHVHTKAPDEAAHRKDPLAKRAVIESLDRAIGEALGALAEEPDLLLAVTADHSTPSSGPLVHSGDAVPLALFGPGVRRDAVTRYDEVSAAQGALGCVRGKELMYLVLNHLGLSKLAGTRDTPWDQPYWPGDYQPFRLE
ncbi:MAG: alkaline phosphatase family protein [Deferrisomatales bacterium]